MEFELLIKKYKSRIEKEALLKALLVGVLSGFSLNLVYAVFSWIFFPKFFWIGLLSAGVIAAAITVGLYILKFKPDDRKIAKRIDGEFGLDERILTMYQYNGVEDSYILKRQREDAAEKLGEDGERNINISIGLPLIIVPLVMLLLSLAFSLVSALSVFGVLPDGQEAIDKPIAAKWFDVTYEVRSGEGEIAGETEQRIEKGRDAAGVLAVPEDDWVFSYWDDGLVDPYRKDTEITGNMSFKSVFTEAEDLPLPNAGENEGTSEKEADDDPDKPPTKNDSGNGSGNGTPTSLYSAHNQVIDGETFYGGTVYDVAYEEAMDILAKDTNLTEAEREIIINYFKSIEQ